MALSSFALDPQQKMFRTKQRNLMLKIEQNNSTYATMKYSTLKQ